MEAADNDQLGGREDTQTQVGGGGGVSREPILVSGGRGKEHAASKGEIKSCII